MTRTEAIQLSWGPLAMTEENYRKVVAGEKWQTRRIAPYPELEFCDFNGRGNAVFTLNEKTYVEARPKYQPGEIYYLPEPVELTEVRPHRVESECEGHYLWDIETHSNVFDLCITSDDLKRILARKGPKNWKQEGWKAPTTARFMLKSFAREFVRIKGVKVERLQDISEGDAIAEGIGEFGEWIGNEDVTTPKGGFSELWNSIHGPDAWEANPWVWVYEFERLEVSE